MKVDLVVANTIFLCNGLVLHLKMKMSEKYGFLGFLMPRHLFRRSDLHGSTKQVHMNEEKRFSVHAAVPFFGVIFSLVYTCLNYDVADQKALTP